MKPIKSISCPIRRISREPGQHFFGYYDLQPFSADERYHLCMETGFMDRLQVGTDSAKVGMLRICDGTYIPIADTYAWCFQQASMLQWNPRNDEEIVYNIRHGDRFYGCVRNVHSVDQRLVDRPVTNLSRDGRWALSVSFTRMFDFRPGYGYAGVADPDFDVKQPSDDGIWVVDMDSGKADLVISLETIGKMSEHVPLAADGKLLINHLTFSPTAERFVYLARWFPTEGRGWRTAVFTANRDGSDIHLLNDWGHASHYYWNGPDTILFWCLPTGAEAPGLFELKDKSSDRMHIAPELFTQDVHMSTSPDGKLMLWDTYPDSEGYRGLGVYDIASGKNTVIGEFYGPSPKVGDIRCDLHPRWSRSGRHISFDSIHEGLRHVYMVDREDF